MVAVSRQRTRIGRTRVAGLIAALAMCATACDHPAGAPEERSYAEDFTLERLGGGEATLSDSLGRPVVIDFWATWCMPCIKQVPMFNDVQAEFGDRLDFFAVATDAQGAEAVAPFAEEHGIEYPVLLGSEALAQRWGLIGFPTLFLIRPDGSIREAHVGPIAPDELKQALETLLAERD